MSVGIVGAGITGLATLHHLEKRGIEATCFETRSDPGGVIRSPQVDDRVLEAGPQRLRLTEGIQELIDDCALWSRVRTASDDLPLYVYSNGALREAPRSLGAFVRTDLLSTRGKLRAFCEPLTDPGRPAETAAALFTRKFGREAYERFIGPVFGGTYGSDPDRMPARYALSGMLALEAREGSLLKPVLKRAIAGDAPPPMSFDRGLETLPRALYESHADRIQLETPVTGLHRAQTIDPGKPLVLETAAGTRRFDRVVITTPAPVAAELLAGFDGASGLSGLRELSYNPLAVVHLDSGFEAPGFGYQVRWTEGLETLGVTWNASLFGRNNVYTAFLGGMKDPEVLDRTDADLGATAAREFERVTDAPARAISVSRWERGFPAHDGSWAGLDDLVTPVNIDLLTNYTARTGVAGRVRQAKAFATGLDAGTEPEPATAPAPH